MGWLIRFFDHPLVKGLGLAALAILGNVLAGAYVLEITKPGSQALDWSASPHSKAFWAMIAVVVVTGLYAWGISRAAARAQKALTDAEIRQRAIDAMLPLLLARGEKDIEEGKISSLADLLRWAELLGSADPDRSKKP